jgi:hypothetical protein
LRRVSQATDAVLARRLEQIELLIDLHSAGMKPRAVVVILDRIRRVRRQLERRAAHGELLCVRLIEMRRAAGWLKGCFGRRAQSMRSRS